MYCPKCGHKIASGASFCTNCGASIEKWNSDTDADANPNPQGLDYPTAVRRAREGDNAGFTYLYEQTYKSKYYLALKYMGNQEAAEDVLQDAYVRAFSKLDTLQDPTHFSAWLGTIVANTAKNELQKKNPTLFSEMESGGEEIDERTFEIPDEDLLRQPEMAYTQKETQELVQQMMGCLSEEQRMCILMYYMDDASVKEIARALDCSENTVKSRLSYGRKNLKAEADRLEKKGYKLYGLAPLPLLLLLLRGEAQAMEESGALSAGMAALADRVVSSAGLHTVDGATAGSAYSGAATAAQGAAKGASRGFLHTAAGRVVAAILAVAVAGTAAVGGAAVYQNRRSESAEEDEPAETETVEPADPDADVSDPFTEAAPTELPFTVTRQDTSILEAGQPDITNTYDLIQIQGEGDAIQRINETLLADYQTYLAQDAYSAQDRVSPYPMTSTVTATVTNNGDGIFSVVYEQELDDGVGAGVGLYGFTFRMDTGEQVAIQDLSASGEAEFLSAIQAALRQQGEAQPGSYIGSEQIDQLSLSDLTNGRKDFGCGFAVQDNELVVLAPGGFLYSVEWPSQVPTGIFVSL